MKYIRLFFLVSAVALTLNMFSVTAHAAETETEMQTFTQEASGESIEVNNSDTISRSSGRIFRKLKNKDS